MNLVKCRNCHSSSLPNYSFSYFLRLGSLIGLCYITIAKRIWIPNSPANSHFSEPFQPTRRRIEGIYLRKWPRRLLVAKHISCSNEQIRRAIERTTGYQSIPPSWRMAVQLTMSTQKAPPHQSQHLNIHQSKCQEL